MTSLLGAIVGYRLSGVSALTTVVLELTKLFTQPAALKKGKGPANGGEAKMASSR